METELNLIQRIDEQKLYAWFPVKYVRLVFPKTRMAIDSSRSG